MRVIKAQEVKVGMRLVNMGEVKEVHEHLLATSGDVVIETKGMTRGNSARLYFPAEQIVAVEDECSFCDKCSQCTTCVTAGCQCVEVIGAKEDEAYQQAALINLPAKSLQYFKDLAEDAGNWSGNPWLDGNVQAGKGASAMSQALVDRGLITIGHDDGDAYAIFTPVGVEFAASLGIKVND